MKFYCELPSNYVALFKFQENIAALTASIYSSSVAQTKKKSSTISFTSIENASHKASDKIASVNEPQ